MNWFQRAMVKTAGEAEEAAEAMYQKYLEASRMLEIKDLVRRCFWGSPTRSIDLRSIDLSVVQGDNGGFALKIQVVVLLSKDDPWVGKSHHTQETQSRRMERLRGYLSPMAKRTEEEIQQKYHLQSVVKVVGEEIAETGSGLLSPLTPKQKQIEKARQEDREQLKRDILRGKIETKNKKRKDSKIWFRKNVPLDLHKEIKDRILRFFQSEYADEYADFAHYYPGLIRNGQLIPLKPKSMELTAEPWGTNFRLMMLMVLGSPYNQYPELAERLMRDWSWRGGNIRRHRGWPYPITVNVVMDDE
jgi:hypothetical protein